MKVLDTLYDTVKKQDGIFGIEVEAEGIGLFEFNKDKFWKSVYDGSIRGIEYVSRKPKSKGQTFNDLDYLYKKLENNNCELIPSVRTSVHVHVNVQEFTLDQLRNFILLYLCLEEPLKHFCGKYRENNIFCQSYSQSEGLRNIIKIILQKDDIYDLLLVNDVRYSGINLNSIVKFGSLEFRTMQFTKTTTPIKNWINMLDAIRLKALEFESVQDILMNIDSNGYTLFAKKVLGNSFKHISKYKNLDKMINESTINARLLVLS